MRKLLLYIPVWLPSVLCLAAILWLTLAADPTPDIEMPSFEGIDKLCHAIMFGGFTICLWFDSIKQNHLRKIPWWLVMLLALASSLTGVVIEYLQQAMGQGRSFEYADMFSDVAGAFLVAVICIRCNERLCLYFKQR